MTTYILQERPLTDDVLHLTDKGKVFNGNYIAIVQYHTFKNAWVDTKHIKRFRKQKSLDKFLAKNYPNFSY